MVPAQKHQATLDGCHRFTSHQGRDHTLRLLQERFWRPGMSQVMMMSLQNCGCCKMYEAKPQIPGMELILCTEPMELIHIDYGGMEVTVATNRKLVVKNVLVVIDHFTWFVQVYITRNQTTHTTA